MSLQVQARGEAERGAIVESWEPGAMWSEMPKVAPPPATLAGQVFGRVPLAPAKTVDEFVATRTFECPVMKARLTPDACVDRQDSPVLMRTLGGTKLMLRNTPFDCWCRGGECHLGRSIRASVDAEAASFAV